MATSTIAGDTARTTGDRWEPVDNQEATFRRGDAVLTFDGPTVRVVRGGRSWEEEFDLDRAAHFGGFFAILDALLQTEGLQDGTGLEEVCARVDAEEARQWEEQLSDAQAKLDDAKSAVEGVREKLPPGSFADRVEGRRVDLVRVMEEGIKPATYIPGSGGTLIVEARHHVTAPRKVGKSITWQATALRIVRAGGRVAILDRENGARIYALRLQDFRDAWGLTPDQLQVIRDNLHYYAFPSLRREDRDRLAEAWSGFDLVIFDSQRGFQTSLGMKEDSSDDYGEFMDALIDPLHRAGIATLVLHNEGHKGGRGRGTSSQGDLHDVLFTMKKTQDYFIDSTGEVALKIVENREGTSGEWTMEIGGGKYEDWTPASARSGDGAPKKGGTKRKSANLARTRELLADDPDMTDAAIAAELGLHDKTVRNYRKELDEEG